MARERVEDLGRILVMVDNLLELDVWDLLGPRPKHAVEQFLALSDSKKEDTIHKLAYELQGMHDRLSEVSCICSGWDDLNHVEK